MERAGSGPSGRGGRALPAQNRDGQKRGPFGYADTIQRADGTVLLMRVLNQLESALSGEEAHIALHFVNQTAAFVGSDCVVSSPIGSALNSYGYHDYMHFSYMGG